MWCRWRESSVHRALLHSLPTTYIHKGVKWKQYWRPDLHSHPFPLSVSQTHAWVLVCKDMVEYSIWTQPFTGRNFYRISLSVKINFLELFHALPLKCAVHDSQQLRRTEGGGWDGWGSFLYYTHVHAHQQTHAATPPQLMQYIRTTVLLYTI